MDERLKQLLVLGREHYERREYDRAERALRQVLEHTDRYADVFNMLAVICHDRGDFVAAETYFERAVELNPNYTEALLNLSVTYNDLGKYEAARQVYARVRGTGKVEDGLDPFVRGKIANMHADLAQAYSDAGLRSEAIEQLRKAVALCPAFADLQTKLGTLHRDDNNLTAARQCYEAARAQNPTFVPARVLLGVTLLALGATEEAAAEWREALTLEPENRSAKMYLRMVEGQRSLVGGAETPPNPPAQAHGSAGRTSVDGDDGEDDGGLLREVELLAPARAVPHLGKTSPPPAPEEPLS
jgi:tetratricopeptide (TPR) repeat protein